jgi:hypothetical protein
LPPLPSVEIKIFNSKGKIVRNSFSELSKEFNRVELTFLFGEGREKSLLDLSKERFNFEFRVTSDCKREREVFKEAEKEAVTKYLMENDRLIHEDNKRIINSQRKFGDINWIIKKSKDQNLFVLLSEHEDKKNIKGKKKVIVKGDFLEVKINFLVTKRVSLEELIVFESEIKTPSNFLVKNKDFFMALLFVIIIFLLFFWRKIVVFARDIRKRRERDQIDIF